MSGAEEGYIRTWSRHMDEASRDGIDSLVTIGDVLPPAALPMFTKRLCVPSYALLEHRWRACRRRHASRRDIRIAACGPPALPS